MTQQPQKICDLGGGIDRRNNKPQHVFDRYDEYMNLLLNSVKIRNLPFNTERYVKRQLFENGSVGYDRPIDLWAKVAGQGKLNAYGDPTQLTLTSENGRSYTKRASYEPNERGAYKIDVLPQVYSLTSLIRATTDVMKVCDETIIQNLKACKSPVILVCRDPDMQLSIQDAIQQQQLGYPVVVTSPDIAEGIKGVDMAANLIIDQISVFRDHERDELLNKIGTMTANINKRERVQVGEVDATIGKVVDYSHSILDTWNDQMEAFGLDFKMEFNASMEELYAAEIAGHNEFNDEEKENTEDESV